MEQRHPVTQMALSFRDHSGLQTPVTSQQHGFHDKMEPHRMRVLEVVFCGQKSPLQSFYQERMCLPTISVDKLLTHSPSSIPPSPSPVHPSAPSRLSSSSILFPGHCQTRRSGPHREWIVPLECQTAQELSKVLPRLLQTFNLADRS